MGYSSGSVAAYVHLVGVDPDLALVYTAQGSEGLRQGKTRMEYRVESCQIAVDDLDTFWDFHRTPLPQSAVG